jgi:hypothetical protein
MFQNPSQYKYDVESAALGTCNLIALLPVGRLPDILDKYPQLAACHHYAICRRPKITTTPVALKDGIVTVEFSANHGKDGLVAVSRVKIAMPEGATLDSTVPNILRMVDENGDTLSEQTAAELLTLIMSDDARNIRASWDLKDLDLEIVYIGQALGPKEDRSAVDRLLSHRTLQTILADTLTDTPHLDVWIVLMAFESNALSQLGPWKGTQGSRESVGHFVEIVNSPLHNAQLTNLVEGALIAYFQPPYNRTFKSSFPAPAHTSYGQVYVLDYNCVAFELSTREIFTRIGSKAVEPAFEHTNMFPLHDKAGRRAFFSWFDNPEVADALVVRKKDPSADA